MRNITNAHFRGLLALVTDEILSAGAQSDVGKDVISIKKAPAAIGRARNRSGLETYFSSPVRSRLM